METTTKTLWIDAVKYKAALELLRLKATSQMCDGKTTCTLDEKDIKEILFVAGMSLRKEVEVM